MGVRNADLIDLLATTLADLPKQEFDVAWDNQEYEFCRIYQKDRIQIDGGTQIERNVMLDHTGNARYRRLYDTDEPSVGDTQHKITVPWSQIGTNYSWDKLEILRNRNSEKGFVDLLKSRRIDGLWALAQLIETKAWETPASSTDDLYPYGVPYYLTPYTDNSGTVNTGEGFNGKFIKFLDDTYSSVCAGIDANTEAKWRNYTGLYTKVDAAMLKVFRKAFLLTRFKAPLFINDPSKGYSNTKRIYCDADTSVALQDLMDQKDDNHRPSEMFGGIMVAVDGAVFINKLPVVYIPELIGAALSPIYCVNYNKFVPFVQDGFWMEESEPMTDRRQHTTLTVFLDGAHNNLCTNRREAGFVLHKAS